VDVQRSLTLNLRNLLGGFLMLRFRGAVMNDYSDMTKAELITRLRSIDAEGAARGSLGRGPVDLQKETKVALRDSQERLRAILETAVEGIITIDERGLIESMNAAAIKIFGYEADEVLGRNVSVFMPSPFREEHDSCLANYRQTGQ